MPIVKPPMTGSLDNCGLPVTSGAVVNSKGLAAFLPSRGANIGITRSRPQVIICVVRIRDFTWVTKVGGQHTADELDVVFAVMPWYVGAVKDSVIGNGNTLGATAVTNPHNPVGIDAVNQCTSSYYTRLGLVDECVGVAQCGPRCCIRGDFGVVVVAHDNIAVGRKVIADVVIPVISVPIPVTNDDEGTLSHRRDICRVEEMLGPFVGGDRKVIRNRFR